MPVELIPHLLFTLYEEQEAPSAPADYTKEQIQELKDQMGYDKLNDVRFSAHVAGAGEPKTEVLLRWIGNPGKNRPSPNTLRLQEQ